MEDAGTAPNGDAAEASASGPMDTDAGAAAAGGAADAKAAGGADGKAGKKKVKKVDVPVKPAAVAGMDQKVLDECFEKECAMQASDRLQEETNEKKNALEG
jgi:heat shock protein 4